MFRFRNDSDIVPHLPLGPVFRHAGSLQFIDGAGHLHHQVTPTMELMLAPVAQLLSAREATALGRVVHTAEGLHLPLPGFLADHAPINYSILVWNCYDARER